jgi:DUF2971 family protein
MLGFGALGEFAIGEMGGDTLALTSDILQEVVTRLVDEEKVLPPLPPQLHHYTSLETAYHIINGDNVRLSHAEYSNDQTEMGQAKDIIRGELKSRSSNAFFGQVLSDYETLAPTLDAYIFCMSTGNLSGSPPQDLLSQWRAYGQDGRGACLTLDARKLGRLVYNTPGLRINPVIYQRAIQLKFVGDILDRGLIAHSNNAPNAREATIAALVFATPLMKALGFEEELEWRLIFMPPQVGLQPQFGFQARRDFLAPYIDLTHLWHHLRPIMVAIPALRATLPTHLPAVGLPLVPITEVMIGPSGHQTLNVRALTGAPDRPLTARYSSISAVISVTYAAYPSLNQRSTKDRATSQEPTGPNRGSPALACC